MSPRAVWNWYVVNSCSATARAINKAVSDGVDIANFSWGFGGPICDRSYDCSNLNATIRSAANAGLMTVWGSMNGDTGSCFIDYPAYRPEAIAVARLDSWDSPIPYNDLIHFGSGWGGMDLRVRNPNGSFTVRSTNYGIGLATPGEMVNVAHPFADWAYGFYGGTSSATPVVSGAAGLLRHALNYLFGIGHYTFHGGNDARILLSTMLMLGDGYDGGSPSTKTRNRFAKKTGAGRLRLRWPSSPSDLTSPFGWGFHQFTIHQGQVVSWPVGSGGPMSSSVQVWKALVTWFESDLNSVSDIDVSIVNTCPAGGGSPVTITSQADFDLRNRFRLTQSEIQGKCLQVRVTGFAVAPAGVQVFGGDYFDSGTSVEH